MLHVDALLLACSKALAPALCPKHRTWDADDKPKTKAPGGCCSMLPCADPAGWAVDRAAGVPCSVLLLLRIAPSPAWPPALCWSSGGWLPTAPAPGDSGGPAPLAAGVGAVPRAPAAAKPAPARIPDEYKPAPGTGLEVLPPCNTSSPASCSRPAACCACSASVPKPTAPPAPAARPANRCAARTMLSACDTAAACWPDGCKGPTSCCGDCIMCEACHGAAGAAVLAFAWPCRHKNMNGRQQRWHVQLDTALCNSWSCGSSLVTGTTHHQHNGCLVVTGQALACLDMGRWRQHMTMLSHPAANTIAASSRGECASCVLTVLVWAGTACFLNGC